MPDGVDTVNARGRKPRPPVKWPAGPLAGVNATVAFILEVSMLAAWAYVGYRGPAPVNFVAGIGLPLAVVVVWGLFFAPRAARRIPWPWLPLASLGMFVAAGIALVVARQPVLGTIMIVVAFANTVLSFWLRRKD